MNNPAAAKRRRILIADDHAIVREGLKLILSHEPDLEVVAEAVNAREAMAKALELEPDLMVLDVDMPGGGGLDLLHGLRRERPDLGILVFSFHPEDPFAIPFLREGADGYLMKDGDPREIVAAVKRICEGRKYMSQAAAEKLASSLAPDYEPAPHERLTVRELLVLGLLSSGCSATEAGKQLSLCAKTVRKCQKSIQRKTQLETHSQIVSYAMEHGLYFIGLPESAA